jgi:hypothetical protein
MSVTVEVYPGGLAEVYTGGTISTSARVTLVTAPDDQELTWDSIGRRVEAIPVEPDEAWPPAWFGSIRSARTDTAARTEEILRAGFGRDDHR